MPEDASAPRLGRVAIQDNHAFTRGTPVRFDGSNWVKALAGESGIGLVGSVQSSSQFEFIQLGFLDGLTDGGYFPGSTYYVSDTVAGTLTTTTTSTPIFNAYTATSGYVVTSSGGGTATGSSTGVTAGDLATAIATEVSRANSAYSLVGHTHTAANITNFNATVLALVAVALTTTTADYAALVADRTILVDATAAPVTITLPAVTTSTGAVYTVKKIDATSNSVTIGVSDAAVIDGASTYVLSEQYAAMSVQSDGTNWHVVYRSPAPTLLV